MSIFLSLYFPRKSQRLLFPVTNNILGVVALVHPIDITAGGNKKWKGTL
jgi:hypothetical protein